MTNDLKTTIEHNLKKKRSLFLNFLNNLNTFPCNITMKVNIRTKEIEIEKGKLTNESFFELIMYYLPVSELYFQLNYLMD